MQTNAIDVLKSSLRHVKIRIDLLNWEEKKIGSLEGDTINGSISIDGSSIIRRTASFTLNVTESNYNIYDTNNPIALNKKIQIWVGIKDQTKPYSDFYWFNMGIYVMTRVNLSISTGGQVMTLTAQDKMCLHDGTVGGRFDYTTRLDITKDTVNVANRELVDSAAILTSELNTTQENQVEQKINEILKKLSNLYSNTQKDAASLDQNNDTLAADIQSAIKDFKTLLLKFKSEGKNSAFKGQLTTCQSAMSIVQRGSLEEKLTLREIIKYVAEEIGGEAPGRIIISDISDYIRTPILLKKGETIRNHNGQNIPVSEDKIVYKLIKHIYPSELTQAANSSAASAYESINKALNDNYEYFYDVDGFFHFQEKRNYVYTTGVSVYDLRTITTKDYKPSYNNSAIIFNFADDRINTAYQNTPNWTNIANDIFVWSTYDNRTIGYHLVIDEKPVVPTGVVAQYDKGLESMDWREYIIHSYDIGLAGTHGNMNTPTNKNLKFLGRKKSTEAADFKAKNIPHSDFDYIWYNSDSGTYMWNDEVYTPTAFGVQPDYYQELSTIWKENWFDRKFNYKVSEDSLPDYNMDMIDNDSDLSKYSVRTIGRRTYAVTDNNIKSLYPTRVADMLLIKDEATYAALKEKSNENVLPLTDEEVFFVDDKMVNFKNVSTIYKDAYTTCRQLLLSKTTTNDQVTISSLPFYMLEVNNRVYAYNKKAAINGYFLLNKITFDLSLGGLMQSTLIRTGFLDKIQ